jgi:protein-S-isoprenylcysteine O-methyltransferase Ste14
MFLEANMKRLFDAYLLAKPSWRGWFEWGILALSGILGLTLNAVRLPLFPISNIFGAFLFVAGLFFHLYAEWDHREAHKRSSEITGIVDRGIYAKIRHPLYLSLIAMDLGIALAFGILWTLVLACVFSVLAVLTSLREERFLLSQFPQAYACYQTRVPWRMVPGLF